MCVCGDFNNIIYIVEIAASSAKLESCKEVSGHVNKTSIRALPITEIGAWQLMTSSCNNMVPFVAGLDNVFYKNLSYEDAFIGFNLPILNYM